MSEIFDLDAIWAEEAGDPFTFRWAGRDWVLPPFSDFDLRSLGSVAKLAELSEAGEDGLTGLDIGVINDLFEPAFGPEQWAEWQNVPQQLGAITKLLTAWQQHSAADLGEASASTGSSPSTGRPSKPTSTGATKSASAKPSRAPRKSATRRANS